MHNIIIIKTVHEWRCYARVTVSHWRSQQDLLCGQCSSRASSARSSPRFLDHAVPDINPGRKICCTVKTLRTVPIEVTEVALLLCLFLLVLYRRLSLADHVRDKTAHGDITPPLLPEKFYSNQNYNDWVSHFECVSKINGWGDSDKALWFKTCMTGKAQVACLQPPES